MVVGAVLECNVQYLYFASILRSIERLQAHKARLQTGDGFELVIKRANPKLYSSSCVEVFGTVQVSISLVDFKKQIFDLCTQPDLSIMEVRCDGITNL
jgi:hypothetical protein